MKYARQFGFVAVRRWGDGVYKCLSLFPVSLQVRCTYMVVTTVVRLYATHVDGTGWIEEDFRGVMDAGIAVRRESLERLGRR